MAAKFGILSESERKSLIHQWLLGRQIRKELIMPADMFRFDWYPQKSFIGFARLHAEQIGVLMQIINLIYIQNGPIKNDVQFIGKNCNLPKGRTRRIINELLELKEIYLTDDAHISQSTCDLTLSETRNRIEKCRKNGKKGSEIRWENKENQADENGGAINLEIGSTNNNTNNKTPTSRSIQPWRENNYNIDHLLSDEARRQARECAPGYDQQVLMKRYNERINQGVILPPMNPNSAYPMWCKRVATGKQL